MEIFEHSFMRRAFLAGTFIAVLAPVIGIFLVLRRYALIGEGLGHIAFSGVALGLLARIEPFWAGLGLSTLAALGIERLRAAGRLGGDAAIAVFLSGGLALGLVAARLAKRSTNQLWDYLFGSILLLDAVEIWKTAIIAALVLAIVFFFSKEFFFITFDEETARAAGLRVGFFNALLVVLAALTIVASIQIVGLLLISALIVLPVAAGLQLVRRFRQTVLIALGCSLLAMYAGLFGTYYWDLPSGAAIVLAAVLLFAGASALGIFLRRRKPPQAEP
jgi:zinc transport system permease protein